MSNSNNLVLLAQLLEQCYVLPYDHGELVELLAKIQDGRILTKEEYDAFRLIVDPDNNVTEGDVLFTGNYMDLINKPFIPTNMVDLRDYPTIMARINQMINSLAEKDRELAQSISDNARFLSALELVLQQDIDRLTRLIETATLFQGDSLESVIENIQGELGWLAEIRDDIQAGKVLSEKDFTATYEEILKSIDETAEGIIGIVKDVIAESIKDPGQANGNGNFRLDSIGEALATKVDKVYGYGLSQYDFNDMYRGIIEPVAQFDAPAELVEKHGFYDQEGYDNLSGTLQGYILDVVSRYEEGFQAFMNDLADRISEYTENAIQDIKLEMAERLEEMEKNIDTTIEETLYGVKFKEYDGPTTIEVGALKKGTHIAEKTIREVLLEILCPFATPTVSAHLELAPHSNALSMIGEVVEIKGIVANIDKGSLPINQVIFKQKVGGEYIVLGSYDSGEYVSNIDRLQIFYSNNQASLWFPEILEVTQSVDSEDYMVEIYDTEGNYSYSYVQGIDIVYPVYHGVMPPNVTSNDDFVRYVKQMQYSVKYYGEEHTQKYTTKDQCMVIAIPQDYGAITDIIDQNGYIITNSFQSKTVELSFEVKESSSDGQQVKLNTYKKHYFVYYNNPSTVTGFDVTFKF